MATVNPQFERSFATLAYAFVQEKAQKLMPYLVGFQVINKSDDDTRAAGAFGFQVGDQWMYAPMFFLNGDLKGHELLYVKTPDLFIPMQENWVNFILSHDARVLGEGEDKHPRELGVLPADLTAYYRSPLYSAQSKYSSAVEWEPGTEGWLVGNTVKAAGFRSEDFDIAPLVDALVRGVDNPELDRRLDLREVVKDAEFFNALGTVVRKHDRIKEAVSTFYDGSDFVPPTEKEAAGIDEAELARLGIDRNVFNYYVRDLATRGVLSHETDAGRRVREMLSARGMESPADVRRNLVGLTSADEDVRHDTQDVDTGKVELLDKDKAHDDLSDKEAQALLFEGYDIRDTRKEASEAYDEAVLSGNIFSPVETGAYLVLGADNEWHKCLVVVNPRVPGKVGYAAGHSLVVCGKKTAVVPTSKVCATERYDMGELDLSESSLGSMDSGSSYVLVSGDQGDATVPCRVHSKKDGKYYVNAQTPFCYDSNVHWRDSDDFLTAPEETGYCSPLVRMITTGPRTQGAHGMLALTDDWKAVKVDSHPRFECGDLDLAAVCLAKVANLVPITVSKAGGSTYTVQDAVVPRSFASEKAAVWYMVSQHGLTKEAALEALQRADRGPSRILVKHARSYGPSTSELDNIAQYDSEYGYPIVEPRNTTQEYDTLKADYADQDTYAKKPTESLHAAARQAAAQGEKEVMDVGVLTSLVEAVNIDRFTEKYLKDLTRGLDRVGRILFLYYWHYDKFKDKHGEDEMQELEDALSNTFKAVGDTVLFLKKRTIEPERMLQGSDVSLDEVSGQGI